LPKLLLLSKTPQAMPSIVYLVQYHEHKFWGFPALALQVHPQTMHKKRVTEEFEIVL
jgi:hypothetical protein